MLTAFHDHEIKLVTNYFVVNVLSSVDILSALLDTVADKIGQYF